MNYDYERRPYSEVDKLRKARSFSVFLSWEGEVVDHVGYELLGWSQYGKRDGSVNMRTAKRMTQLGIILGNLNRLDPGDWLQFSRKPSFYSDQGRYKTPTTKTIISVMDELIDAGLVEQRMGTKDIKKGTGFVSKVRPMAPLLSLLGRPTGLYRLPSEAETIILREETVVKYKRDSAGKAVKFRYTGPVKNYKDDKETRAMRKELRLVNNAIAGRKYLVYGNEPDGCLDMHRVFNNKDWSQGGRYYGGWWESSPKKERPGITIDGEQSTCIDYRACFIAIAYGKVGLEAPVEDPYALPCGLPRSIVKDISMYHLGGKNREACIRSHYDDLKEDYNKGKLDREYTMEEIAQGFAEYAEKHAPIAGLFFSGVIMRLMLTESEITTRILHEAVERNIPVLPLHDGYITTESYRYDMGEMMQRTFKAVVGQDIRTKVEY